MYDIIKRYCENDYTNGLLLLDMPTGSGKTYSVVKYIFDAVQDQSIKRKIFFITTQKKNLPEEDLRKRFENAGQLALFKEKVLRVDSNYESVILGFTQEIIKDIPYEIKKTDEYKALEQYVLLVKSLRKENRYNLRSALHAAEDSLRKDAEPKFRRMVQALLAKQYFTVEDRLLAIKTQKAWKWVAELYPSVFMRDRQIIFMSMDKFLVQNATIVEPPTMLYNSDIIDNAVIFIDEFDATKDTVLNSIIQNGLRDRIDYVELFHTVYSALHTHRFPAILTSPSKKRQEGPYRDQSLQNVLDKTAKIADDIHDAFSLQYSHKTEHVTDDNINNFLFQDHQYHSILNGNKAYITAITNHRDRINTIRFSNERPGSDQGNIQVMLGKLRGFISYFMVTVRILAINYQQCKEERRRLNEDEFTLEEATRTVLSEFKLPIHYIGYLTAQILLASRKYKGELQARGFDSTFYEKGFRYYAFEDDYAHDMQSKIMMYSFQITPEKLLLRVCEKAKVMGISATATIPSVIGNYDRAYMKEKLADRYIEITKEDEERLERSFEETTKGYDKITIHTELIGGEPYAVSAWKAVADHKELMQGLFDRIEQACAEDTNDYNKERYLRIAVAFKSFLVHENIRSFLCVLTRHPRRGINALDLEILCDIFDNISKHYGVPFNVWKNVVQLDGEEYDVRKDEIIRRLGDGERLFVISVYQTIGAGQNLQYPVPAALKKEVVAINDHPSRGEKDFDGIYLDMPTNLLTPIALEMTEEDFVRHLFHVEMLQENGEVSIKDASSHIKKAFRCFSTKHMTKEYVKSINDCRSVILLSTRIIIQAIGRICRTNLKSKDIYVYADRRIADRIDFSVYHGRRLNPEFAALVKALRAAATERVDRQTEELQNVAELRSVRANKYIESKLREDWTEQGIMEWKELRDMLLRSPTSSRDTFDRQGIAYNYFVKMPCEGNRIYYTQQEDFNKVQVFFEKTRGAAEVSEASCRLSAMMKMPFLKQYFKQQGYATSFEPQRYILSPPLFNNIYRGALGEVAGKALFSRCAAVELQDIEDNALFELFDYVVPGTKIYVDFKNWSEGSQKDSQKEIDHIAGKAKVCRARCVIVANILMQTPTAIREQCVGGIKIVIVPALLTEPENPTIVNYAWETIRRCIREYSD